MLKKIRIKIKEHAGFSLAEMLLVVMIVLMVSMVMAVGIPAAVNAYNKVVDAANAEVLLATSMTGLRDRLGFATEVSVQEDGVHFIDSVGSESVIYKYDGAGGSLTADGLPGPDIAGNIYVRDYVNLSMDTDLYPAYPLVSDSAASKKLYITYGTVDAPQNNNGVIVFHDLKVMKKPTKSNPNAANTVAQIDVFKIRVLTYMAS